MTQDSNDPRRSLAQVQATIVEFLLARIAEDEAKAHSTSPGPWMYQDVDAVDGGRVCADTVEIARVYAAEGHANGLHIVTWEPARVVAECQAKREIVAGYRMALRDSGSRVEALAGTAKRHLAAYYRAMKSLARVYADHPDFQGEWRR